MCGRMPSAIVVAQDGVRNLLGATSLLSPDMETLVRTRGAAQVVPILSQFVILDLHDKKVPTYLVGYEPKMGGGPWQLMAGREPRNDKEAIFDRVLAQRHNLALGDPVEILDRDFTIVGLSDGTASWMTSFVFVRKTALEALLRAPGATSSGASDSSAVTTEIGRSCSSAARRACVTATASSAGSMNTSIAPSLPTTSSCHWRNPGGSP